MWRYLCEKCSVRAFSDLKRSHLMDYIDYRLGMGNAVTTINNDLRTLHGFLGFLQEHGYAVSHALLHSPCLKEPDGLPRFLTDDQVRALQLDFEARVREAVHSMQVRDALLDRAVFYLLWQCGLRMIEVEELLLDDLDLKDKRLTIRGSKSLKDRTVYITDRTVQVLYAYLGVRGVGPTDHVFLYRNQALCKGFVHRRLKAAGKRVGVDMSAHKLRHTCATQLLNAGCRVTSIQKLLGHKRLNTTMIYARVHDRNVAEDYYTAMKSVERWLELVEEPEEPQETITESDRDNILGLALQLAQPEISYETRQDLVSQICTILTGSGLADQELFPAHYHEMVPVRSPPS